MHVHTSQPIQVLMINNYADETTHTENVFWYIVKKLLSPMSAVEDNDTCLSHTPHLESSVQSPALHPQYDSHSRQTPP